MILHFVYELSSHVFIQTCIMYLFKEQYLPMIMMIFKYYLLVLNSTPLENGLKGDLDSSTYVNYIYAYVNIAF